MNNYSLYEEKFMNYKWLLRSLNTKIAEYNKVKAQINSGIIGRDLLDDNWIKAYKDEENQIREKISYIEDIVNTIPETPALIPCKLYIRLHYFFDYTLTETASNMNVSLTTLRRIKQKCISYFNNMPKI